MYDSSKYTKLTELTADRDKYISETVKHVLLLASSMFAILISFHSKDIGIYSHKYLFIFSIICLTLCIVTGIVSLRGNIYGSKELVKRQIQIIDMFNKGYIPSSPIHTIEIPQKYLLAEKWCYRLFILSIFSLAAYTILNSI